MIRVDRTAFPDSIVMNSITKPEFVSNITKPEFVSNKIIKIYVFN